jgi:CDP-diacylglycerol--serine O-phosphatidyltransferase
MLLRWIPNALTLANGLCGVGGLILLQGDGANKVEMAAALVFLGWLFDMVDGIAARRLGTTGAFGAALDSLCDAVTFGALPAALICVERYDSVAVVCAFAFASGTFLRLARYLGQASQHTGPRWYFEGLPSPAAALIIATATALSLPAWQIGIIGVIAAAAMVSRLPYADVPHFYLARRWPWASTLVPLGAAVYFSVSAVAAAVLVIYLLSGPAVHLARRFKPAPRPE